MEANPDDPMLCLRPMNPAQLHPSSPVSGRNGENDVYTVVNGQEIDGARGPLPTHFGAGNRYMTTIGNSNYHLLETGLNPYCSFILAPFMGMASPRNPRIGQLVF